MAEDAVDATESLPQEVGLVGLDGPLDELDLTKMLVDNFEDNGPEETSPSGDAVQEAEPEQAEPEGEQLMGLPPGRTQLPAHWLTG